MTEYTRNVLVRIIINNYLKCCSNDRRPITVEISRKKLSSLSKNRSIEENIYFSNKYFRIIVLYIYYNIDRIFAKGKRSLCYRNIYFYIENCTIYFYTYFYMCYT